MEPKFESVRLINRRPYTNSLKGAVIMRLLSKMRRWGAVAMTAAMCTGLFAGCGEESNRTFPTPTPRAEQNNETTEGTKTPTDGTVTPVISAEGTTAMLKPAGS